MCAKCHDAVGGAPRLGPDLAVWSEKPPVAHLVESVLKPSATLRQGYEPVTIATTDGQIVTGLLAEDRPDAVVLRVVEKDGEARTIAKSDIEASARARSRSCRAAWSMRWGRSGSFWI